MSVRPATDDRTIRVHSADELPSIHLPATRTLRMTVAYDGTDYCGWQIQPNGVSVQSVIEQALMKFTGERTKVIASGRTDAGVHSIGQVISFTTTSTAPCRAFTHGMAPYLPEDIVIRAVAEAEPGFNARFDAQKKWYRYVIHNSPIRNPFLRNAVFWQRSTLNQQAMHDAASCLLGEHDFRSFETQWPNRSSSIRTMFHASVTRLSGWNAWQTTTPGKPPVASNSHSELADACEFIAFDFQANGFLYNMVRSLVGTLIHVGRGRWTSAEFQKILTSGSRAHAGETAPPQGLYLMKVDY